VEINSPFSSKPIFEKAKRLGNKKGMVLKHLILRKTNGCPQPMAGLKVRSFNESLLSLSSV